MARLTVGWPVVGARTADGMDAIQSLDPTIYAQTIGFGNMSLQNAGSVNITGGYISSVTMGVVGSGCAFSGNVEAFSFRADNYTVVGDVITMAGGGMYTGVNDTTIGDWIYLWGGSTNYSRIGIPDGHGLWMLTESAPGMEDGQTIMWYDGTTNRVEFHVAAEFFASVGFYGTTPISQVTVAAPSAIVTTQTAGATYSTNEQIMMDNLKTDVTNLRTKLNEVITTLKSYGLFG